MNRVKPSFWLFLGTKFPPGSLRALVMFVITFPIIFRVFRELGFLPFFVSLISLLTVAIILRFIYEWEKYKELSLIFQNGAETVGKIVDVHFSWAFGYIIYEYQYQEGKCSYKFETYPNKKAKDISVGQQVILYVNQEKPLQAFMRDLYLNTF